MTKIEVIKRHLMTICSQQNFLILNSEFLSQTQFWELSFQHVFLESCKCIITIAAKILLHNSPEKFNKVQLRMKFWKKYAEMAHSLNDFLDKRLLLFEVRLQLENAAVATTDCIWVTFILAFPTKVLIKASFGPYCFSPLLACLDAWWKLALDRDNNT